MDIASIAGILLALAGILGGLILEGGTLRQVTQPTALMIVLGGYNSSNTFNLARICAARLPTFHIAAPDLPGFGLSEPSRPSTFDRIAEIIDRFTDVVGFDRYAVYVFDYGAPTGFRPAVKCGSAGCTLKLPISTRARAAFAPCNCSRTPDCCSDPV